VLQPAIAIYVAVRGIGLLGSSLGAYAEKRACEGVLKEMLDTSAPLPRRRRYLLAGLRVDKACDMAPPGTIVRARCVSSFFRRASACITY
jgi:hypothetical protein